MRSARKQSIGDLRQVCRRILLPRQGRVYSGSVQRGLSAIRRRGDRLTRVTSAGKRILIDGQQRVTALMAALLGREVLTKDYDTVRIRIAFHPQEERFEVANPAIRKDVAWIHDVAEVFAPSTSVFQLVGNYCTANPGVSQDAVFASIENLRKIINNHVGVIELADDLDIETVTEIFIRLNSAGTELSQADFAMSKIAVNESYGGNLLRFLDDPRIEPTNNRAERALRPAVIARKVSQCSKNARGAQTFTAFTSVIRTLAKTATVSLVEGLLHVFHSAQMSDASAEACPYSR